MLSAHPLKTYWLVNYVHVGGLNIQEAQAIIESALKKGNFLTSPYVSILVTEDVSGVVVIGVK